MAMTTFSGPVKSLRGFISAGPDEVVNITAETTLTFASYAGKVIKCNDADGAITAFGNALTVFRWELRGANTMDEANETSRENGTRSSSTPD